jgi:hypothetical protein
MTALVKRPPPAVGELTDIISALLEEVAKAAYFAEIQSRMGSFFTPEYNSFSKVLT